MEYAKKYGNVENVLLRKTKVDRQFKVGYYLLFLNSPLSPLFIVS